MIDFTIAGSIKCETVAQKHTGVPWCVFVCVCVCVCVYFTSLFLFYACISEIGNKEL